MIRHQHTSLALSFIGTHEHSSTNTHIKSLQERTIILIQCSYIQDIFCRKEGRNIKGCCPLFHQLLSSLCRFLCWSMSRNISLKLLSLCTTVFVCFAVISSGYKQVIGWFVLPVVEWMFTERITPSLYLFTYSITAILQLIFGLSTLINTTSAIFICWVLLPCFLYASFKAKISLPASLKAFDDVNLPAGSISNLWWMSFSAAECGNVPIFYHGAGVMG